jgi:hypothetical protein
MKEHIEQMDETEPLDDLWLGGTSFLQGSSSEKHQTGEVLDDYSVREFPKRRKLVHPAKNGSVGSRGRFFQLFTFTLYFVLCFFLQVLKNKLK